MRQTLSQQDIHTDKTLPEYLVDVTEVQTGQEQRTRLPLDSCLMYPYIDDSGVPQLVFITYDEAEVAGHTIDAEGTHTIDLVFANARLMLIQPDGRRWRDGYNITATRIQWDPSLPSPVCLWPGARASTESRASLESEIERLVRYQFSCMGVAVHPADSRFLAGRLLGQRTFFTQRRTRYPSQHQQ